MTTPAATGSRRDTILRATIRLLGVEGPAGVTHRAVAAEAGVPLAATTYYFASKDELLREALAQLAGDEVLRLRATRDALGERDLTVSDIARGIAAVLTHQVGAAHALAKFEVYLEGCRGEALRNSARATVCAFVALAEDLFDEDLAPIAVAGIDGLLLHELVLSGGEIDEQRLAGRIELLLARLVRG